MNQSNHTVALINLQTMAAYEAMDSKTPFSWTKGGYARQVQVGDYIRYSQDFFAECEMTKTAA